MGRLGAGGPALTASVSPKPGSFTGTVPALAGSLRIARALRPIKRTVESQHGPHELDEEATAHRASEDGLWLPEFQPVRERWLDLIVVIDDSRFAALHRLMCRQILDVVISVGAFRTVQVYLLDTDTADLTDMRLRGTNPGAAAFPAGTVPSRGLAGRRLLLVLSDGVGDAWHSGAARQLLAQWGRQCPVGLLHLLPQWQWRRTGVPTRAVELRTPGAAAANHRYQARFPSLGNLPEPTGTGFLCVPVIELDAAQIRRWARFIAAAPSGWYGAATVCGQEHADARRPADSAAWDSRDAVGPLSAAGDLVRQFRAAASPAAFTLAVHLAAAPLNPSVMRLVQRVMLPGSRPCDLSEVVGSGLLRRVGPRADWLEGSADDRVTYDFAAGVREQLLAAGRRSDTARVLLTVASHLGDRVGAMRGLRDVLLAPKDARMPPVSADALPFVQPSLCTLRALAGPYLPAAQKLESVVAKATSSGVTSDVIVERDAPSPSVGSRAYPGAGRPEDTFPQDPASQEHPPPPEQAIFPGVSVTVRTIPPAEQRKPEEPPPVWGNVPPRNISFTGREQLLTDLHERLSRGTTAVLPEALHGMGGVGKSQIAIEYVYRHTTDYDLIWWIPSERPSQIQQALVELASELGLQVGREVNMAVPAVREALRLGRPFRTWLLVFDNAENIEEARSFFPTNGPGKILVTSRNAAWSNIASSLEVDVFTRPESLSLLGLRGPDMSEHEADQLAEVLGDLPLAIEQAAVWLAETGMPVEEYLRLFRDKATELLRDASQAATYELPVAAAWNVSLERLRASNPAALQLLQVCAFFASEPISRRLLSGVRNIEGPPELAETLADPIKLSRAIRAINQYALAKISHRHNTILLHRLVQQVLTAQMTPQEAERLRHCGHLLLTAADPNDPISSAQWPQYAELLPHVLTSGVIDCQDRWARHLVLNLIDFLFRWGDQGRSLDLGERAVDAWTTRLGEDHEQTLAAEVLLGKAHLALGQFKTAYDHHVHARDLLSASLGADHERTLEAQGWACGDLRFLGDFARARELGEQTYETARRRFGPDDPVTLVQAHFHAIDLRLVGKPQSALELDRDTHRRRVQVLGEDHLATLGSLAAIAVDEMECGRYVEARNLHQQITKRLRTVYGETHPDTMEGISTLSVTERKAGAHDVALELSREAVALFRTRYGEDYPLTVAANLNHAVNLRHAGDLSGSATLGIEASERCDALFGPRHPNTPSSRVNLAVTLRLLGRTSEARHMNEDALVALSKMLGPDHPRSLICSINLASDLFALGEVDAATARDRDTLARCRRIVGDDHPTTLACALNLTLDLRTGGDGHEAETLFADTLARYRRVLSGTHPATILASQSVRADCDIYPIPV